MEFQTLGPMELFVAGERLDLGPAKQRLVLAVLLLEAGRMVPIETLIDRVWGERPPREVRNVVYTYVTRLRRVLYRATSGGDRAALLRQPGGYLLDIDRRLVDLHRFRSVIRSADRTTLGDGERARALREALDLWHGPPLAGLTGDWVDRIRDGLDQQRVVALAEWSDVELRLGRPAAVVDELQQRLAEYPSAEPLLARQIQALHDSGRRAEALSLYAKARQQIAEELGVEPDPQVRQAYEAVVRVSASPDGMDGRAGPVVRGQLPPGPPGFAGRAAEVAAVRTALTRTGRSEVTIAISGVGGVGKSALALHVAHLVAASFPDGQLYVDLQGASPGLAPLEPEEALGRFLRALGDRAPTGRPLAELAARFRDLTAGRALLVVLDNARDAVQVRALLPAGASCAVIVTSRRVLATLDGATQVHLGVMAPHEAVAVLGALAGVDRIQADPPAAGTVADLCGYLPLALRIAGARLVARPGWPVRTLAERLAQATRRLDELRVADLAVRSSLAVSHESLAGSTDPTDRAAAAAFPLLGLPDWPELCLPSVARLLDRPEPETERMLERLVDAQLIQSMTPDRYHLHDLLRLYAREETDRGTGTVAALARAMRWYLDAAWQAFRLVRPGDPRADLVGPRPVEPAGFVPATAVAALDWLDTERTNLVTIVNQAAATPDIEPELCTRLGLALPMLLVVRGHLRDWLQVSQAVLATARRVGDRTGEAYGRHDLGVACERTGEYEQAQAHFQDALTLFIEIGDRNGQAACLYARGMIYCQQQRVGEALEFIQRSLALRRELGDRHGESTCLRLLGTTYHFAGDLVRAGRHHQAALDLYRELGDRLGQATALSNVADIHQELKDYQSALAHQREALEMFREIGDRYGQAVSFSTLGTINHRLLHHAEAVVWHQQALAVFRELGLRRSEAECLSDLSDALRAQHHHAEAEAHKQRASSIFSELSVGPKRSD